MGLFSKLAAYGQRQDQKLKEQNAAKAKNTARETIQRIYHTDISTMSDREKDVLKGKIEDSVAKSAISKLQKYKGDKALLAKIRERITAEYGVDKELLSEIKPGLITGKYNRKESMVEVSEAYQEINCVLCDLVITKVVDELEQEFKELIDGKVLSVDYGDGDEGMIYIDIHHW